MGSPLVLSAVEVLRRPGAERRISATCDLGLDDPRIPVDAEATVELRLDTLTDGVVVDGVVSVPWTGTCRRCLGPAEGVLHADVHELYQPVPTTDPDAFEIDGDYLDLRPMVREVILLDAPQNPLCRADCRGLCPTCGADRNVAACDCTPLAADDRWAALAKLRGVLPDPVRRGEPPRE